MPLKFIVVKNLKIYRVPFSGLSDGSHDFEFDVNEEFFSFFEHSLVKNAQLKVRVNLQKDPRYLSLDFDISGKVELSCDTCLNVFWAPFSQQETVLVKFDNEEWEDDAENEVIVISPKQHELDLVELIYEFVNVHIPPYPKCDIDGELGTECDPEMLSYMEEVNSPTEEKENNDQDIDPRWAALKNIKNN